MIDTVKFDIPLKKLMMKSTMQIGVGTIKRNMLIMVKPLFHSNIMIRSILDVLESNMSVRSQTPTISN